MPPDRSRPTPTPSNSPGLQLLLPADVLRPLVTQIVAEVLGQLEQSRAALDDRLAYSEAEAARLLGLNVHQLRDERLRKRISASQIVGNRIRYTRQDLERYLLERRVGAEVG